MGVNLSKLVISKSTQLKDYKGKKVAIDAPNALYQFLSIIRQRNGTPLKDAEGRVTSHLAGLLYRTANLVEQEIKPVYVFDGVPHPLKKRVLQKRREVKEKAMVEWQEALETGDLEEARKKAQQTSRLTPEHVRESKELLDALGIPYVDALGEGEAQASQMAHDGCVDLTASQDFDSLLFGSPLLLRNLALTGKRKLAGKQKWIDIQPERIALEEVLVAHGITREQLVDIAILIGTDFNKGVAGIGPSIGLKLIKEYRSLDRLVDAGKIDTGGLEEYREVQKIFLHPAVVRDFSLQWKPIDRDAAISFLCSGHQFSLDRVETALAKFGVFSHSLGQKNLFDF